MSRRAEKKPSARKAEDLELTLVHEAPEWDVVEVSYEDGAVEEVEYPNNDFLVISIYNGLPTSLRERIRRIPKDAEAPVDPKKKPKADSNKEILKKLKIKECPVMVRHEEGRFVKVKPGMPSVVAFHTWAMSHNYFIDLRKVMYGEGEDAQEFPMDPKYEENEKQFMARNLAVEIEDEAEDIRYDDEVGPAEGDVVEGFSSEEEGRARASKTLVGKKIQGRRRGNTFSRKPQRFDDVGDRPDPKSKHNRSRKSRAKRGKKKEKDHMMTDHDVQSIMKAREEEIERRKKGGKRPKKADRKPRKVEEDHTVDCDMGAAMARAKAEMEARAQKGNLARSKTERPRRGGGEEEEEEESEYYSSEEEEEEDSSEEEEDSSEE